MGSGFAKKKKQAKQMQEKFMQMQEQMKELEVEGTAGNGLVTVTLNGENQLVSIKIKPDCVDPEDVEGLEVLIKAAHADATEKLTKETSAGMPPGMPDLSSFGF
jgi:DNA-binding YbaB/EbfC family protein